MNGDKLTREEFDRQIRAIESAEAARTQDIRRSVCAKLRRQYGKKFPLDRVKIGHPVHPNGSYSMWSRHTIELRFDYDDGRESAVSMGYARREMTGRGEIVKTYLSSATYEEILWKIDDMKRRAREEALRTFPKSLR